MRGFCFRVWVKLMIFYRCIAEGDFEINVVIINGLIHI